MFVTSVPVSFSFMYVSSSCHCWQIASTSVSEPFYSVPLASTCCFDFFDLISSSFLEFTSHLVLAILGHALPTVLSIYSLDNIFHFSPGSYHSVSDLVIPRITLSMLSWPTASLLSCLLVRVQVSAPKIIAGGTAVSNWPKFKLEVLLCSA